MKHIAILSLVAIGLLLNLGTGKAQTANEKESSAQLTDAHKKAKEHTDAIATGQSKSKQDHKKHAAEAGKSLTAAKTHHAALKKAHNGKNAETHAAIEKNHADADKHLKSLNDELDKPNPDEKKVKEHAKNHSDAVNKAHQEHEKLKTKA